MKKIILFVSCLSVGAMAAAQPDSIYDQNTWRNFIVHLPAGYTPTQSYPLVFNLHGYNSNAAQQQSYSQFDMVADTLNFIVVYPEGINQSWAIGGTTDVDFIAHLTDTIRNRYSCTSCLFITGMSDGAFMTYKLACTLPYPITAIAAVSGNMANSLQNNCSQGAGLPVLHIHGTDDPLVYYTGVPPLIPPVDSTIQGWVQRNSCNPAPQFTALPDLVSSDSCTAERYSYTGGTNGSQVIFYKIIHGGHTWPGANPVPPLGFTNQDISASMLIGTFFSSYCPAGVSVPEEEPKESILPVFPNPTQDILHVSLAPGDADLAFTDLSGRLLFRRSHCSGMVQLDLSGYPAGVYFLCCNSPGATVIHKVIIAR